jgi:hypothetical protein
VASFWLLLACAVAMVLAQDVYPGAAVYHTGWYNALDIALFVLAAVQLRPLRKMQPQRIPALAAAAFGGAIVVFSGAASGLMGPDTHVVVGAPGASVRDDDVGGSFVFPLQGNLVALQRGRSSVTVGSGRRYAGGFILWEQPRTVLAVQAADRRGNHLTITQPTNASFLSPVLLLQQRTTINGMDVRFDSFSVPAMQRNVKAVFFTEQQAAQLRTDPPIIGQPAILFAVSTTRDQMIPGGIGIVPPGVQKSIGGLRLSASVTTYPAVVVASAPYVPILALGLLLIVVGAIRTTTQKRLEPGANAEL